MDKVRDLITRSLRLINAFNVGEEPDSEEANDALDTLNDMLDAWSLSPLMLPFVASAEYQLEPGKKVYSLGPNGDWNGVRPIKLRYAMLRIDGALDIPLQILENQQYGEKPLKGITSPQPWALYYEPQPNIGYITLYPVPSQAQAVVLSYDALFSKVTLDTPTDTLAPGLRKAIRYNLAIELGPEYSRSISADVRETARAAIAAVKSSNVKSPDAVFDPGLPGVGMGRAWDYRLG